MKNKQRIGKAKETPKVNVILVVGPTGKKKIVKERIK